MLAKEIENVMSVTTHLNVRESGVCYVKPITSGTATGD